MINPVDDTARDISLGASCLTPFADDGSLNEAVLRRQLARFVDTGVDMVWLASSGTAEGNVLTDREVDRIAEIAVAEVGGRIRVVAMGREPRSAVESIDFARRMLGRGVDAVQVGPLDPGHSYLPTPAELRQFFETTLDAIDGESYLSSHISVGYEVPPSLLVELAKARPQVAGVVITHMRSYTYAPHVIELAARNVPVHLGSPFGALEGMILGATGIVTSFDINVAPWLYQELRTAWRSQDVPAMGIAHARITGLFRSILTAGGLIVAKAILERLGLEVGTPRPPRRQPDDAVYADAERIIELYDLRL
jgi:4-hydroxy-tetrahydrodipicolinate synthase